MLAYNRNRWFIEGLYHGREANVQTDIEPLLQKLDVRLTWDKRVLHGTKR